MDLELAQVAAGLPMAASLALAGGLVSLREGRRRTALNEAMHELRRPLQVLSLSLSKQGAGGTAVRSSLLLATAALDRLDCEINGRGAATDRGLVALEGLLAAGVARWRPRARAAGRSLRLRLEVRQPSVEGDEVGLAQALDNMISNAIEHGAGTVSVEVRRRGANLLIAVRDAGPYGGRWKRRFPSPLRACIDGRRRRGHGLRVVQRVARAHGGSFELRRTGVGAEARLELPSPRQGTAG